MVKFGFQDQLAVGAEGEELVMKNLTEHSEGWFVVDTRSDPRMQKRGIDFILVNEEDYEDYEYYEVKTDTYDPINFFFELSVDGGPGWLDSCSADILVYYFINEGSAYFIPLPALRQWGRTHLAAYEELFPNCLKTIASREGGREWVTEGITVPVSNVWLTLPGMRKAMIYRDE